MARVICRTFIMCRLECKVGPTHHKSLMLHVAYLPISGSYLSKIECYVTRIPIGASINLTITRLG